MTSNDDDRLENLKFKAAQVDILSFELHQKAGSCGTEQDIPDSRRVDRWDEDCDFSDHEFPIRLRTAKQMLSENSSNADLQEPCLDNVS